MEYRPPNLRRKVEFVPRCPYAHDVLFDINRELPPLEVRPSVPHFPFTTVVPLMQLVALIKYAWIMCTQGSTVDYV